MPQPFRHSLLAELLFDSTLLLADSSDSLHFELLFLVGHHLDIVLFVMMGIAIDDVLFIIVVVILVIQAILNIIVMMSPWAVIVVSIIEIVIIALRLLLIRLIFIAVLWEIQSVFMTMICATILTGPGRRMLEMVVVVMEIMTESKSGSGKRLIRENFAHLWVEV